MAETGWQLEAHAFLFACPSATPELCYRDCSHESNPLTAVNAVTRQLPTRIHAVINHVQLIVSADGDIRASPVPWIWLGRLIRLLNWHFQVRPRVTFGQDGEDAQATAETVQHCCHRGDAQPDAVEDEVEKNYRLSGS